MTTSSDTVNELLTQALARIDALEERLAILENSVKPREGMSKQHAIELGKIMDVFLKIPIGFQLSIPAIAENLEGIELSRETVTTRVYTLVKAGKLKRHQDGNTHPTFSRLP
jgi:hypothetical protein